MTQLPWRRSIFTLPVGSRSNPLELPLTLTFRRMEPTDLEKVITLDRLSFSLPWPESSFVFEIEKNPVSRCWVAELIQDKAEPVMAGIIVIWLIVDEAHIATFAIHPDYRRIHIAQRFLAHTLIDAYHSGAVRSFLEVRRGNLAARALYTRFGYREVGVRKNYYKDNGEDAIMMNLEVIDLAKLESLQ